MLKQHSDCLNKIIFPQLRRAGVIIESYKTLDSKERRHLDRFFQENVFPILTPQSVDSSHPFPYISNLSLNLGFYIEPKRENIRPHLRNLFRQKRFARIKIPPSVPRFIPLAGRGTRFVLLEEIIAANAEKLFPNMKVSGGFLFRVTRDADIEIREDEAGDLMRTLETELQRRRFRFPVRLEVAADMPEKMLKLLSAGIGLEETDCYRIDGFMGAADLMQLYSLDLPKYKFKPFQPVHPALLLEKKNIFEVLKKEDVLLHHPYTAFTAVSDFAAQAAEDPRVQAIKICLYRTGRDSPIVRSLIRANQAGKQVTAVVELKARFDEENNIEWARRLENEGVHVVYGISRLKTHCKAMMVVRREGERLVRYVHLSTGNYNSVTARQYTDLGLLTSDNDLGEDVAGLFNFLTGYSQQVDFKRLIVAPVNLREQILNLIKREAAAASAGLPARIIIKINSLTDTEVIEELYNASQAGVEVDLIVRGICSLRPGVKALSQRIRVKSIVGRFLEHSRIFYFANGDTDGKELLLIGSADLMQRNLDRRVEIIFPILNSAIKDYLKNEVLTAYLKDNANSWILRQTGSYKKMQDTGEIFDAQNYFIGKEIG
jgi:polyphosphate kinase